jgi:hypothetical protein
MMTYDELEYVASSTAAQIPDALGLGVIVLVHEQGSARFSLGSNIHAPGAIEELLRAALRQLGGAS